MAKADYVQLRCTEMEKARWFEVAKAQGLELSPWIRWVLNREAGRPRPQAGLFPEDDFHEESYPPYEP